MVPSSGNAPHGHWSVSEQTDPQIDFAALLEWGYDRSPEPDVSKRPAVRLAALKTQNLKPKTLRFSAFAGEIND
ncbi:MAG: hypothetical protein CBC82_09065 [Cellvibrionales bacterium TMED122]|nr:hypothetical protein [Halieaceae bacterium]OUV60054.1 MAG: hypothetical protein CBC82_09065 [Cellvibrionales bacterium TMED122]